MLSFQFIWLEGKGGAPKHPWFAAVSALEIEKGKEGRFMGSVVGRLFSRRWSHIGALNFDYVLNLGD